MLPPRDTLLLCMCCQHGSEVLGRPARLLWHRPHWKGVRPAGRGGHAGSGGSSASHQGASSMVQSGV